MVDLFSPSTALSSLRNADFDFSTAIGELIDNSIQANATIIDIRIETDETNKISRIIVQDDGDGMSEKVLHRCLQFGYSTRYNNRNGIGRFGVGASYAGISQAKRITVASRENQHSNFWQVYIDLDEIEQSGISGIPSPKVLDDMTYIPNTTFDVSTMVVWEKCDRFGVTPNGRPIGSDKIIDNLKRWISRVYRYYIWEGIKIYVNEDFVVAHDPLYLRPHDTLFKDDEPAKVVLDHEFRFPEQETDSSIVRVIVTILPETLRPKRGAGGSSEAKQRRIDENEGISVLRHKREVAYGNFYPIVPPIEERDRWWGCEIHFEPLLDEWWKLDNIKRGARPIEELKTALTDILNDQNLRTQERLIPKIRTAISRFWNERDSENQSDGSNDEGIGGDKDDSTPFNGNVSDASGQTSEIRGLLGAQTPREVIECICTRFYLFAQQLSKTYYANRQLPPISDEYDVQHLLHALLKLEFDDVRSEEWTPSYAGRSSRMDFLLLNEKIVIEVKKTRKGLTASKLGEELIIDIAKYEAHPHCRTLICFVYDPNRLIENPKGLENDLSRKTDRFDVKVIVSSV